MQDAKWLGAIPSAQPWRFNNFLEISVLLPCLPEICGAGA